MLFLECDTTALQRQGLSLLRLAASLFPSPNCALGTSSKDDLLVQLGRLAASGFTCETAIIAAHGNEAGVRLFAKDPLVPWPAFSRFLEPFKPKVLFMFSCGAIRADSLIATFSGIPPLRDMYGSPERISVTQGRALLPLLSVLGPRRLPELALRAMQAGSALAVGRQFWHISRDEVSRLRREPASQVALNLCGDWLQHLIGSVRRWRPQTPLSHASRDRAHP